MRILVLGGTAWVGHELAKAAVAAGHTVTCLARGTAVPDGVTLVQADRMAPGAYNAVAAEHWDAVIDVATHPGHTRTAVAALADATDKYVYISTCSTYADQSRLEQDEDAPQVEPLDADEMASHADYARAKMACEQAVLKAFGPERSFIARPGLIGGPGDSTGRLSYWPWRFAHPSNADGAVLVPDAPQQPTSVIDVRDLVDWVIRRTPDLVGIYNTTGDVLPFDDYIRYARDAAGHTGEVVLASAEWLTAHEVNGWGGPRSLPVWVPDADILGIHAHSSARAKSEGLTLRPQAETIAEALPFRETHEPRGPVGLTDDEERELLRDLRMN